MITFIVTLIFQRYYNNEKSKCFVIILISKNVRRTYVIKTRLKNFTKQKIAFFEVIQKVLFKFFYFVYADSNCQLYINLNINKKFDISVMLYYVKQGFVVEIDKFLLCYAIESIFFFSKLIIDVESRY